MNNKCLLLLLFFFASIHLNAQDIAVQIQQLEKENKSLEDQQIANNTQIEDLRLKQINLDLKAVGLPQHKGVEQPIIHHHAMSLVYSEEHEQALWVAHIISPEIMKGSVFRTNDFRPDPKVKTGTAIEADYFLKELQADSTYKYDGFGYDRGHLAPSADFRWSQKALSESYFYSNMSPQLAEFNREAWAELENLLRGYLYRNPETQLHVVTGPILEDGLPVIERGINKVSIPKRYFKVALDLNNKRAIGFIMPNQAIQYPLASFAKTIDEVEKETGLDFFGRVDKNIQDKVESTIDKMVWIPSTNKGDVEPIYPTELSRGQYNTIQAQRQMDVDKEIFVCGTVVSTRLSRKGNVLINLDKQFPNQIFTIFIRKQHIVNFTYNPVEYLKDKKMCFKSKVKNLNGTATMFIEHEKQVVEFKKK